MFHTLRNITPRPAILNPPIPTWLLRPFTSTAPAARKYDSRYPDDEARRAYYKQQIEYKTARYNSDPLFRARQQKYQHKHYASLKNDDIWQLYFRLRDWTRGHEWVRAQLPWKTHVPLLYADKVEHYCHGCDWTRNGGRQLWWRRKADATSRDRQALEDGRKSDEYLCHHCYVQQGHFDALPKGYEDVRTLKDMAARKKQFDQLAAAPSDPSNQ